MSEENNQSPVNEVKVLLPRHKALMRLLVRGWKLTDAATELGYSLSRASVISNSSVFVDARERLESEVDEKVVESMIEVKDDLKRTAADAVKVLKTELKSSKEHIRISAAKDILDRAGIVKEEKMNLNALVEPSEAFISMLARAMKEGKVGKTGTDGSQETTT